MAEPSEGIGFALAMEDKDNLQDPDIFLTRNSTNNLRSTTGVLECPYLALIPALRDICELPGVGKTDTNTKVDLRSSVPREQEGDSHTGFVERGLHN